MSSGWGGLHLCFLTAPLPLPPHLPPGTGPSPSLEPIQTAGEARCPVAVAGSDPRRGTRPRKREAPKAVAAGRSAPLA